ncbi:MAG TPA: hypothetical protein DCL54_01210 [Alphaproteobacteria bacterium]|nr:hypothetical protein [Alphaproteobacteria bacterium]HAJ45184.1 hypothetical protein [Alphaproteobacteria bacterium]
MRLFALCGYAKQVVHKLDLPEDPGRLAMDPASFDPSHGLVSLQGCFGGSKRLKLFARVSDAFERYMRPGCQGGRKGRWTSRPWCDQSVARTVAAGGDKLKWRAGEDETGNRFVLVIKPLF